MIHIKMNKINTLLKALCVISLFSGCSKGNKNFQKGEGDMFYKIVDDKNGPNIQEDNFISLNYTAETEQGDKVFGSYDYDKRPTLMFSEKPYFEGDFFTALKMLSEGDSAVFKVNVDSLASKTGRPMSTVKGKYLIYTVKINKVIARNGMTDSLYNATVENFRKKEIEQAKKAEPEKIARYIQSKKLNPVITASGLNYLIKKQGKGRKAIQNDTVLVNYTGKTLTGKVFETTDSAIAISAGIYKTNHIYNPIKLPVSTSGLRSGFQEAMSMFPQGTKATLIIPSKLAYANGIYKNLQPYTPLTCDVEIIKVIRDMTVQDRY